MEFYRKHVETHKTCGIDGCIFSAHPKLVDKHIKMQHCTGLYHRMKNLSTPEDIEQWIVERKKKYPTKTNIERKQAEQTEKIERGEIIEKRESGRGRGKPVREKRRKSRKRKIRELPMKPEVTSELYRGLIPFAGTANWRKIFKENEDELEDVKKIRDTEFLDISDDEDEFHPARSDKVSSQSPEAAIETPEVPSKTENRSSLASLIANYASDSDQNEAPDEVPIKKTKTEISSNGESSRVPRECESTTKPETSIVDVPRAMRDNRKNQRTRKDWNKSSAVKHSNDPQQSNDARNRNPKRLMLLERLLSRSIQHERNLICQCIKYIADNNFFAE